jgi:hypothetical protein
MEGMMSSCTKRKLSKSITNTTLSTSKIPPRYKGNLRVLVMEVGADNAVCPLKQVLTKHSRDIPGIEKHS